MKLSLKSFLLIFICLLFNYMVFPQKRLMKEAKKQYTMYEYKNAQETYLKVAEKGYKSLELFKNLGNSYYFNAQFVEASKWYKELMTHYENEIDAEYYYRYAQTLKSKGNYELADYYMDKFVEASPNDKRAQLFIEGRDYLKTIEKHSGKYQIKNIDINTSYTDFGTAFYGDSLVFSSSRKDNSSQKIDEWNKEAYLDFFITSYNSTNNALGEVEKWNPVFNTKFHESTPVFTKDKQTVYFTRSNTNYGHLENANDYKVRTNKLKVYRSIRDEEGKWSAPEELPFNNDNYSVAHPALNVSEDKLYFSSDMEGGVGDSDLYEVTINEDGSFGTPQNLGNAINTKGRETFPFICKDNNLYFASDGHLGLGGLDIYVFKLKEASDSEYEVSNLGKPINSPSDDFAFIINTTTKRGFFSSNRPEGKGKDDIYAFVDESMLLKVGNDLANILNLKSIYFDLDKSFIRQDAEIELDKVIEIMKTHPNIKIDIRSHTDSRASFKYNIKLSERRAESTLNYIVKKGGISRSRLLSSGYGEIQLLNKCADGVACSEAAHQLNRRSEFIIIEQ
ncbi:OmpA family protein [Flavivirga sp. 57AJ16]|uniref:OmpA family protein n=1 Tax=Flavivirga sp. 57AJ16 TaxID=3025307 RepID=UPI002366D413|nr:OmpA family protein [Flavivirga sp. 57AJ16]MDD7887970.1 OmpA family protein [Flavivirga sp. 57AJ16]